MEMSPHLRPALRLWVVQHALDRSAPRSGVRGACRARHSGWDGLLSVQRGHLDDFWERSDVEVDGDLELQQAVRFGNFHACRHARGATQRSIPAKPGDAAPLATERNRNARTESSG